MNSETEFISHKLIRMVIRRAKPSSPTLLPKGEGRFQQASPDNQSYCFDIRSEPLNSITLTKASPVPTLAITRRGGLRLPGGIMVWFSVYFRLKSLPILTDPPTSACNRNEELAGTNSQTSPDRF